MDAAPFVRNHVFTGFDGNNETELLVVTDFIINKLQRFEEFKDRDLNSHAPIIGTYSRVLSAFNPAFEDNMGNLLSAEQLTTILKERIHT